MINVICVKWGTKFTNEHVHNLMRMVKRHLSVEYEFICLTDNPEGLKCKTIPITDPSLHGWWAKMNLFSPEHDLTDYVLYFDLDVIIHKDISCFVDKKYDFCSMRDFRWFDEFNSSIMFWNRENCFVIWETYSKNKEHYHQMRGDQNAISEIVKQRLNYYEYPDEWTWSWKWGQRRTKTARRKNMFSLNRNAKVCVFHDDPKPWDISMQDFKYTINELTKPER